MIHEYALEPELVASWHDRMEFRFFVEKFGLGTGRVVARYPKKWKRLVWYAFSAGCASSTGEIQRKRIEELLVRLTTPNVRRPGCRWEDGHEWLRNAEAEHERKPFHAILARDNPRTQPAVMRADDIVNGTPEAWCAHLTVGVARTAASMAGCVAPMLICASRIRFVDPYFRARPCRFRNSMAEFLRIVSTGAPGVIVELDTGHITENAPDWDFFRRECENYLPRIVPRGLTLVVRRLQNRPGGKTLHNRYILTDIGGVSFGAGLAEGDQGTSDDISLLSADLYRERFEDYAGPAYAFDQEGEVRITGEG